MASVNKFIGIGNLGKDPEVRYSQAGEAVCNWSIACTEKWTTKGGEKKEVTEWVRCTAFGRTAEVAGEYLRKGNPCYVEGRLRTRKWTDKQNVERYTTEVLVDRLQLLGGKSDSATGPAPENDAAEPAKGGAAAKNVDDFDDDIPFATNADCFDGAPLRLLRMRRNR